MVKLLLRNFMDVAFGGQSMLALVSELFHTAKPYWDLIRRSSNHLIIIL